jgi:coenzyme F420-reducing hydrogenase delta subunit
MTEPKYIIFTCNWDAYSSLDAAGIEGSELDPAFHPIRVACLGQLSPGILLKAFEKGAAGVLMLGCAPGECRHQFGNRKAEDVYSEVKELLFTMGYKNEQLRLDWVPPGNGTAFVKKVQSLVEGQPSADTQPLADAHKPFTAALDGN